MVGICLNIKTPSLKSLIIVRQIQKLQNKWGFQLHRFKRSISTYTKIKMKSSIQTFCRITNLRDLKFGKVHAALKTAVFNTCHNNFTEATRCFIKDDLRNNEINSIVLTKTIIYLGYDLIIFGKTIIY